MTDGPLIFELVACEELTEVPAGLLPSETPLLITGEVAVVLTIRRAGDERERQVLYVRPEVASSLGEDSVLRPYDAVCAVGDLKTEWSKKAGVDVEAITEAVIRAHAMNREYALAGIALALYRFSWAGDVSITSGAERWHARVGVPSTSQLVTCSLTRKLTS